jgi:hypothetical protein
MTMAESTCVAATDEASGLTVCHPPNWMVADSDASVNVVSVMDPSATDFKTTYSVSLWPIQASESTTSTLALALNNASFTRAQSGVTAYRLLDLRPGIALGERPTMETSYVYVVDGGDLFAQNLPVIVMGLDIAVGHGDQAYIFSLAAARDSFDVAERDFRRFVRSATFE